MARRKAVAQNDGAAFDKVAREVIPIELSDEMERSFLAYSYMTIGERALPDARDGLKPVQRRILYSMYDSSIFNNKPYVKSARVVGNVMGVLHAHGDSSIYESVCNMVRDYSISVPLIDGKGNFGDRPGAGAAAPRYTEIRLHRVSNYLVSELGEKCVPFVPNYDETTVEPIVLPTQFPNLVVNGTTGIAVGYATNMAPHNLGEVIDATRWLLTHPNADVDKIISLMPGPDFPTGGIVVGEEGIRQAYETGRGKVVIRSPYEIKPLNRGKSAIEFYELPYTVDSEKILEQVKDAIKNNKIQGIADAKDLTDNKHGTRLVVETKAGFNPTAVVQALYKVSLLESSFSYNNTVLVDGVPVILGIKGLLDIFIQHRFDTVFKRTEHRLVKKLDRLHLVKGLLLALLDIDEVIRIVRASPSADEARSKLMKKLKVDEVQADYILSLQLRRLTKFDQHELEQEKKELEEAVASLQAILADDKAVRDIISAELLAIKKEVGVERRSMILSDKQAEKQQEVAKASAVALEITDAPTQVYLTRKGIFRGDKPGRKAVMSSAATTTKGKVILVTNLGRAQRVDTLHVGEREGKVESLLASPLTRGEKVIAVVPVGLAEGKTGGIAMGTRHGIVKIAAPQWPARSDEFSVIKLEDGDEVLSARWVEDVSGYEFVFVKNSSGILRFPADKVRPQGLSGGGMAGVKVVRGEEVLAFAVVSAEEQRQALVVTVSDQGNGKTSQLKEYPQKGRATAGMRSHAFLKGEKMLKHVLVLPSDSLMDGSNNALELPVMGKRDGSGKPVSPELLSFLEG